MPESNQVVFLLDVDNTLLDNDRVSRDLREHVGEAFGEERQQEYWNLFEQLRSELGYADYLGALQRYRIQYPRDARILEISQFLVNYHFANRLHPGSLDAIDHLAQWGPTVILSDGDVVFQPRKVERAGLLEAVKGCVLIYIHKELMLDDVALRFPAQHYVMFDDKIRILTAMKEVWHDRLTTVFVKQGHYALDPEIVSKYPPADLSVNRIGEVTELPLKTLVTPR
jgi:FMN phosphatase YigB (HAD superfamily)